MVIPPYDGVQLIEYRDRMELTPFSWVREFVGLGRKKVSEVGPGPGELGHEFIKAAMGDGEIWVIARWLLYEDGREEVVNIDCLDSGTTEQQARKHCDEIWSFANLTKEDLQALSRLFAATEEDLAYIENRFPGEKRGPADRKAIDDSDVYQAQLKVLAGMQPKTVELIHRAENTEDPQARAKIEREAVQAYFAEMAHHWTEDEVLAWQRSNPVGTAWMCEFAKVLREPERELDPINCELVLGWLRRKYNLLTEEEVSDAILVRTGQRVMPGTLKKRRERLGLTTKRPPGPRPKDSQ